MRTAHLYTSQLLTEQVHRPHTDTKDWLQKRGNMQHAQGSTNAISINQHMYTQSKDRQRSHTDNYRVSHNLCYMCMHVQLHTLCTSPSLLRMRCSRLSTYYYDVVIRGRRHLTSLSRCWPSMPRRLSWWPIATLALQMDFSSTSSTSCSSSAPRWSCQV